MLKKWLVTPLCALIISTPAYAGAILADGTWYRFSFGSTGSFADGSTVGATTNPSSTPGDTPPWTFSGAAKFTVLDLFIAGDEFRVYDNGVTIFDTSAVANGGDPCREDIACALADARYSIGSLDLGAGNHAITIQVSDSPFGSGGAVFQAAQIAQVPEPGSLALLGAALGAFGLSRRRKKL